MALGSGFILDPAGYIVTNNVVANADKVTVTFQVPILADTPSNQIDGVGQPPAGRGARTFPGDSP